jgi:hypothetical protein
MLTILNKYSRHSYIHFSVSDLHSPLIGLPFLLQENRWAERYLDRSQTHKCGNWDKGRAIPFLGIHKSKFLCSVKYVSVYLLTPATWRNTCIRRPYCCGKSIEPPWIPNRVRPCRDPVNLNRLASSLVVQPTPTPFQEDMSSKPRWDRTRQAN